MQKTQRHRARKRNATVPGQPVTAAAIAERFALFDGCAYCGADEKLTVDHFIALNDGGLHVPSNLVGACGCCNSSKKDKPC
jgi:5-methylcytosine-specific restriction endonuclease McrA